MVDVPGRSAFQPDGRVGADAEEGWGSPVPAEYGSLRAVRAAASAPSDTTESTAPDSGASRSSLLRRLQGEAAAGAEAAAAVARRARRPRQPGANRGRRPIWSGEPETAAVSDGASEPAGIAPDSSHSIDDTAAVPAVDPAAEPPVPDVALAGPRRRRAHRPARVRTRATVRHVDMVTVVRVAVVFWLVVLVALIVASLLLWVAADAFGSLPSIEKSVRTLFSLKSFTIHPSQVAGYTALVGIVIAVAGTLASIVLALIYNLIADVVGGVRVELESFTRDQ